MKAIINLEEISYEKLYFCINVNHIRRTSFLIFMVKGIKLATDGTLEEPFFLIPIGFLLLFIGFICVVGVALNSVIKKTQYVK